jgi:hypothetical protein
MARPRKPDLIEITVTRKHGPRVIEKTKYCREMNPGETLDIIKAMIESPPGLRLRPINKQTTTTRTNGTTNIINYSTGKPTSTDSATAVG